MRRKNDLSEFMETLKANKHNLTSCQYQKLKTQSEFMETLKANKHNLTSCQYQKLKTQALAGNYIDARKGLKKFLKRKFG